MPKPQDPSMLPITTPSADADASNAPYTALLGLAPLDAATLVARVTHGLAFDTIEHLSTSIELPLTRIGELVNIPRTTMQRRRKEGHLHPDESDRLVRMARIIDRALDLFAHDADAARRWLDTPRPALGGATPLDFARTDPGAREVEDLIGRLEHGIPS